MTRVTLTDVITRQEALHEAQRAEFRRLAETFAAENARLAEMLGSTLEALGAALEAITERRQPTQSVTLKRTGTGQNPTAHEVTAASLNGESLHDVANRVRIEYELLSNRFPLPSGVAHAAELGPWPGAE